MHDEKHIISYILLIVGLTLFAFLFYFFRYNTNILLLIGSAGSLFYVLWGIIHHALEGRLTKFIFLEYLLIGIFVFALLSVVIVY